MAAATKAKRKATEVAFLALAFAGSCGGSGATAGGGLSLAAAPDSADSFGSVADFAFIERSGRAVTRADLDGAPWIAGFFFTRCSGPCPRLTANMRRLQERLEGSRARLVSISVDPEHDTPEVLRAYADSFTADPDRWWFLSGDEESTYALMRESFALSVEKLPGPDVAAGRAITHATRLVTVDAEGRVRGYYDAESEEGVAAAHARLAFLCGGRPRSVLPALNATLNGTAAVLLVLGLAAIKRGSRTVHARLMVCAFLVSSAFLMSYLYYHFAVTAEVGPTRFNGTGWVRGAYLALLLSHTVLAVVNLPMVLRTIWLAHRERWAAHARMARFTYPVWLYVSVTGVLIYLVLYHGNPAAAPSS
jgi:protein SCO1/2/putative membrane protein